MFDKLRWASAGVVGLGLVGLALASDPGPDEPPPRPRPGLTAQQTKEAVKLAQGAMVELRKKTEGASDPGADRREYVVGVELLSSNDASARPPGDSTAAGATATIPTQAAREARKSRAKDKDAEPGPRGRWRS